MRNRKRHFSKNQGACKLVCATALVQCIRAVLALEPCLLVYCTQMQSQMLYLIQIYVYSFGKIVQYLPDLFNNQLTLNKIQISNAQQICFCSTFVQRSLPYQTLNAKFPDFRLWTQKVYLMITFWSNHVNKLN